MSKRTAQTIFIFLFILAATIILTGCSSVSPRARQMCAVEEVETEVKNGVRTFEVDFKNGKEQPITQVQYNAWKRDLPSMLPCP